MPQDTVGLGLPHHIAVIVKDIDKTIEFLSSTLGIEAENHVGYLKDMFAGKPFHVKAAHANLGGVLLELLQPLEEDSVLGQFLKTKGEGLHHIAFRVSNWDEIVPKLKERGSKILQGGTSPRADVNRWAHIETKPGGIILELGEKVEGVTTVKRGPNISPETVGLGLPHHIAAVVKDIDETAEFLSSTLGIVFYEILRNLVSDKLLAVGKPHSFHAAHSKLGPIGFELLQPLDEDSMLGQFLKTKGGGLHHIAFRVSNWDEIVPKLIVRGSKVLQGGMGRYADVNRWAHWETGSGGIILELGEKSIEE